MVVLVSRKLNHIHKRFPSKLDHLQDFRAKAFDGLEGLAADSNGEISFSWIEKGLKLLHGLDTSFKKLYEAVDCPMSDWGPELSDEYLGYTLHLLDLFNSISSSLSHLQSLRLALAHALSSPSCDVARLLEPTHHHHQRNWGSEEVSRGDGGNCHGKDKNQKMLLQGLLEMKGVGLWVCRVILCGLGGEMISKDLEMNYTSGYEIPLLVGLESRVYGEVMEVKEMNEMVNGLLAAKLVNGEELKEMQEKVEKFQRKLEEVVEEVNCLFSEVLASRNRLMDCFRLQKE